MTLGTLYGVGVGPGAPDLITVRAQRVLWDAYRVALEPGGATAFAALLSGRYTPSSNERVVAILCGANREL